MLAGIFCSVAQSCPTLCDPMNCSTPGLPVHHQLPESTQTHVHWVGDATQPSHPLSPLSSCLQSFLTSGSFQMSQLFSSGGQSIGVSTSASEARQTETIITDNWPIWSQDHSLVKLNETKPCGVGPPKMDGIWWRGLTECGPLEKGIQTTSVFLPCEPREQYEKAKRWDTERWTPQVSRCPICYWRSVEK